MVLSECQSVKQHKSIFLLKIQSKRTQRAQNLNTSETFIELYLLYIAGICENIMEKGKQTLVFPCKYLKMIQFCKVGLGLHYQAQ